MNMFIGCYGVAIESPIQSGLQMSNAFIHLGTNGGALSLVSQSAAYLVNSVVTDNSAISGGAIYLQYSSSINITNSVVTNNTASRAAGGIYCSASSVTISSSSVDQ